MVLFRLPRMHNEAELYGPISARTSHAPLIVQFAVSKKMLVDSIEVFPVEEGNSNDPTTFNVGTSQATSDSHVISRKSQE